MLLGRVDPEIISCKYPKKIIRKIIIHEWTEGENKNISK